MDKIFVLVYTSLVVGICIGIDYLDSHKKFLEIGLDKNLETELDKKV